MIKIKRKKIYNNNIIFMIDQHYLFFNILNDDLFDKDFVYLFIYFCSLK